MYAHASIVGCLKVHQRPSGYIMSVPGLVAPFEVPGIIAIRGFQVSRAGIFGIGALFSVFTIQYFTLSRCRASLSLRPAVPSPRPQGGPE